MHHKKMTFGQASVCVLREYREWKYQKMSEVGGLAYRFSGFQSSSQEQSSRGNYNREIKIHSSGGKPSTLPHLAEGLKKMQADGKVRFVDLQSYQSSDHAPAHEV